MFTACHVVGNQSTQTDFCCKGKNSTLLYFTVFSDLACAYIADQVFPILLEQFELHKQV